MKKKCQNNLLTAVSLILVIATTTYVNAQSRFGCKPITDSLILNEAHRIKLDARFIKEAEQGRVQTINFEYHFRYFENTSTHLLKESIDSICMSALINDIYMNLITPKIKSDLRCKDGTCIAGLKIQYGLRDKSIVFLYQPVYLTEKKCASNSCTFDLHYISKPDFYTFDSKIESFVKIHDMQQLKADTASYNQKIGVKRHHGSKKFKSLKQKTTWLGDSKGIIFSFQEILKIYHMSYPNEIDGNRYANKIDIHNGAAFYIKGKKISNFFMRSRIKHTSFITSRSWSKDKSDSNVLLYGNMRNGDDNVANLGHLCPPSCNDITYPILE
jgi:hypothetical protein